MFCVYVKTGKTNKNGRGLRVSAFHFLGNSLVNLMKTVMPYMLEEYVKMCCAVLPLPLFHTHIDNKVEYY